MSRQATGLRAWALQRVSAVYLGLYLIYALAVLISAPPDSYQAWKAQIANPLGGIALMLFVVALLLHVWVGLRDVLIDYIHHSTTRVTLLSLIGLGLIGSGLWAARAVFLAGAAG